MNMSITLIVDNDNEDDSFIPGFGVQSVIVVAALALFHRRKRGNRHYPEI